MNKIFALVLVIMLASVIVASGCISSEPINPPGPNNNTISNNSGEVGADTIPSLPNDVESDTTPTVPPF